MTDHPQELRRLLERREAVTAFSDDIKGAISLRESFFQRDLDTDFLRRDGKIFWAIDPAIINKYFRATEVIDTTKYSEFQLFASEKNVKGEYSDQPEKLFDVLVGRLIGAGLGNTATRHSLLLLPGHTSEAKSAYDRVIAAFEAATEATAPRTQLIAFLDKLDKLPVGDRVRLTERHQEELHLILYGLVDAHQKFRTFASALAERRLVTVKGSIFNREFEPLHRVHATLSEIAEGTRKTVEEHEVGSETWWRDQLRSLRQYAEQDAIALNRLFELNKYLENRSCRIILVTDNRVIRKAAALITPRKYSGGVISQETFSDLYIRHPKSFLSDSDILLPRSELQAPSNMTGWLDAFLAKIYIDGKGSLASFRAEAGKYSATIPRIAIARHALERNEALHRNLATDWDRHVRNVLLAHVSTSKDALERYAGQLAYEDRDRVEVLSDFESLVSEMTEGSWSEFFLSAARSGYELVSIVGDRTLGRMRNMPVLYFRALPEGERLLKLLYAERGVIKNAAEIRDTLESLNTSDDPADFYVAALCVCILFAYADRWAISSALANRAAEIGNRELKRLEISRLDTKRGKKLIFGREANYLACVTGRLTARSIDDLERCDRLLDQAIAALAYEEDFIAARDIVYEGYAPITGLRTDTERAAIETARMFFMLEAAAWKSPTNPSFRPLVRENVETTHRVIKDARACESVEVRRATLVNLRLNLFSNWLLLEIEGDLTLEDTADAANLVDQQLEDILCGGPLGWDKEVSPIDAYSILYAASFDTDFYHNLLRRHGMLREFVAVTEPRAASLLMPYDRVKCRRMIEFANNRTAPISKPE